MRAEFDASFSRPPSAPGTELDDVLALRVGADPAVLRLAEIRSLVAQPLITAVPTPAPALLGMSAERGFVIAVYDLGVLLGGEPLVPRWMVISAAVPSMAVAFEHFEGYRRIEPGPGGISPLIEMSTLIETVLALSHPRPALTTPPQFRSGD